MTRRPIPNPELARLLAELDAKRLALEECTRAFSLVNDRLEALVRRRTP